MLLKILFWLFIALDAAVLGVFALLALAAATPSKTNPVAALLWPAVGALILAAAIAMFVASRSTALRILALLVAASPVLIAIAGRGWAEFELKQYTDPSGEVAHFPAGPLRDIEKAIARNDAPAVTAAAARAKNLNQTGLSGVTVLQVALLQLKQTPKDFSVLRALLQAGADPNARSREPHLFEAIAATRHSGIEPVRMLLDAGAKPEVRGDIGEPAYFIATGAGIDPQVMQLLLDRGADPKAPGLVRSAMNTRNWRVVLLLLQRGADPSSVRERLASETQIPGSTDGLAEVLEFVKTH